MSVDGFSNNAYEYLFLAQSGATRSQGNLNELEHETRRERLMHGRSVDQYVEMNTVFHIALDEEEERPRELQRGKSEDLDCRKKEPVAITSVYENMIIKQQNPRRKLRRNPDYEEHEIRRKDEEKMNSSVPGPIFVSNAFIMIKDDYSDKGNMPLSPTHYQQPPTPDHPPPSALQAEHFIHEKIRPLSQVSS